MKNYYLYLLFFLTIVCSNVSNAQQLDRKAFEQTIHKAIEKSYAASVRIWPIDSVTKIQNNAQFSGVVVDTAGHILTAAHAILPGEMYKVTFPDGKEFTGVGLGRMAYDPNGGRPDLGMIKIVDKGKWPYAEMGWSFNLKINEPCISIAYPLTLNQSFPTIRVGRITNPLNNWGFIQSTCKMEPGDSGGPLFDYKGRLIGIHSRIDLPEDINHEIPVDLFRKYWTALTIKKDYASTPETTNKFDANLPESTVNPFMGLENIKNEFVDFETPFKDNSLVIKSLVKGRDKQILGTLFFLNVKATAGKNKSRSFIVSKSSEVGDSISVYFGNRKLAATIISRKKENDLVLLQLKEELKSGLQLSSFNDAPFADRADLGKFLISIIPNRQNEISALSSGYFDIAGNFSSGNLGISTTFVNGRVLLTRINPNGSAAKAGLVFNDQITGINNVKIESLAQYDREVMKYAPGDLITLQGIREGVAFSLPLTLAAQPAIADHPAYRFTGGRSFRCDGFNGVFAHDALLRPKDCGGPVFDLSGKLYGINIARFSRTAVLALSSKAIYNFITSVVSI